MLRKLLSVLLSVCILLTAISVTQVFASAEDHDVAAVGCVPMGAETTSADFTYTVSGGEVTIDKFSPRSSTSVITVPAEIEGFPVTRIGEFCFQNWNQPESITLPDTIVEIGKNAFYNLIYLKKLNIPSSVKTIGDSAFGNCDSLVTLDIPDTVEHIGVSLFWGCEALKSFTIPKSVTEIPEQTFFRCEALTTVTFHDGVTAIGEDAFRECTSLDNVKLSASLQKIGAGAFRECSSLKSITFPDTISDIAYGTFTDTAWLNAQPDGIVYAGSAAYMYKGDKSAAPAQITVKNGTKCIAPNCFDEMDKITKVILPDTLEVIGDRAFNRCGSLAEINFPDSLIHVGQQAFDRTAWFKGQPNTGMIYAGKVAYYYKGGDKDVITLKPGTVSISTEAFNRRGTKIILPDSLRYIDTNAFRSCLWLNEISIPGGVEVIEESAFEACYRLHTLKIGEGVKEIGYRAFYTAGNFTTLNVELPDSLEIIGGYAFSEANIDTLTVPDKVTTIGEHALDYVSNLRLGKSVTEIGNQALFPSMTTVSVAEGNPKYDSRKNCNAIIETATNTVIFGAGKAVIPDTVTKIAGTAFRGNKNEALTDLVIADSVKEIEGWAFWECEYLQNVTFPSSLEYLGGDAFIYCGKLKSADLSRTKLKHINKETFHMCEGIESVKLPDTLETIGEHAFDYNKSLKEITIPDSVTHIYKFAFSECYSLEKVTFGSSLENIDKGAFENCPELLEVTIPPSVGEIEERALGCKYDDGKIYHYVNFVIYGYDGTEAESYANTYEFKFVSLGEAPTEAPTTAPTVVPTEPVTQAPTEPATQEPTTAPTLAPVKLGDANGDGEVDSVDATVVQRAATRIQVPYSEEQLMCADVDGDGSLTIVDATFIQRYDSRIAVPYPVGEAK